MTRPHYEQFVRGFCSLMLIDRLQRKLNSSLLGQMISPRWHLGTVETTLASFFLYTCLREFSKMIRLRLVVSSVVSWKHIGNRWEIIGSYINDRCLVQVLDQKGVGQLIKLATEKGRAARPSLKVTIIIMIYWIRCMNNWYISRVVKHLQTEFSLKYCSL